MNQGIEDLLIHAKKVNPATGIGVASSGEVAVIYCDFTNPELGTVGAKKTGLSIPAGALIESGLMRVPAAVTGGFNLQLDAAEDVLPAQANPAINAIVDVNRVANTGTEAKELLLNVSAAGSAGAVAIYLRLYP